MAEEQPETAFSTDQRVWLLERDFRKLSNDIDDLKAVLQRILWAIVTLTLSIVGSVITIVATGGM